MLNPLSLELLARQRIQERLDRAAKDALAAQLPQPASSPRAVATSARQHLALALRALAIRLDPCLVREPALVAAHSR